MELFQKKTLLFMATILAMAVGGTFAVTKYLNEQQVKTLEQRIELIESKNKKNTTITIPSTILENQTASTEGMQLVKKVQELEEEKSRLLKQLSNIAINSLDPKSEISLLLAQIEKGNDIENAIENLFIIKDPVTFEPLQKFFTKNSNGGKILSGKLIDEWYHFFISVNEKAGLEFVAYQLTENNQNNSNIYRVLNREISSKNKCEIITPTLKVIALTGNSPDVRAKAKILLQCDARFTINTNDSSNNQHQTTDYITRYQHILKVMINNTLTKDFFGYIRNSQRHNSRNP